MNNYKFRGKTKDEKWVYGFYVEGISPYSEEKKHCIVQAGDNIGEFTEFINVLSETVGQWTGLFDKNGKEIYEGDILVQQGDKGKVIFEKGRFSVKWDDDFLTDYTFLKKITAVVEGNIHDNPELLEVK